MFEYTAEPVKIVDGDTLWLLADLGFRCFARVDVRLAGLNCPEHGTAEGDAATAFTRDWFTQHPGPYVLATAKDKQEKYGRWLGRVTAADGACLNVDLLSSGHAVPYDGGKRLLAGLLVEG